MGAAELASFVWEFGGLLAVYSPRWTVLVAKLCCWLLAAPTLASTHCLVKLSAASVQHVWDCWQLPADSSAV